MPVLFEIFIIACGAIMKGLFIPDVTELGASSDSFPSGIVIPGANVMTLPPGEWVDLSDIDLTSSALDYRVSFSCASNHAYYSADGTIQFAAPDVWPLEYRNGVAVGRHEPEVQATNTYYTRGVGAVRAAISNSAERILNTPTFRLTESNLEGPHYAACPQKVTAGKKYSFSGFIQKTEKSRGYAFVILAHQLIVDAQILSVINISDASVSFTGISDGLTTTAEFISPGVIRFSGTVIATKSVKSPSYIIYMGPSTSITPGGETYVGDSSYSLEFATLQLEDNPCSTSPIIASSAAATRSKAFANIKNPSRIATSVRLHYSDATTKQIDFGGAEEVEIPASTTDWGKRYIQRIEYIR